MRLEIKEIRSRSLGGEERNFKPYCIIRRGVAEEGSDQRESEKYVAERRLGEAEPPRRRTDLGRAAEEEDRSR